MKTLDRMIMAVALEEARKLRNAGHSVDDAVKLVCQGAWSQCSEAVRIQLLDENSPDDTVRHKPDSFSRT